MKSLKTILAKNIVYHSTDNFQNVISIIKNGLNVGTSVAKGTGWNNEYPIVLEIESPDLIPVKHHDDHYSTLQKTSIIKSIKVDTNHFIDYPSLAELDAKLDKMMKKLEFKYHVPEDSDLYTELDKRSKEDPVAKKEFRALELLMDEQGDAIEREGKRTWKDDLEDLKVECKKANIKLTIK